MVSKTSDNWTLIELNIKPCAYLQDVIEGSSKKLKEGTEESGGKLVYCFKGNGWIITEVWWFKSHKRLQGYFILFGFYFVSGENRIIAVIGGDPEAATILQSTAYGELTNTKCTLLRTLESFADTVFKIDNKIIDKNIKSDVRKAILEENSGLLFWIVLSWDGQGAVNIKLMDIVKDHVIFLLKSRNKAPIFSDFYKVLASNETHAFVRAPSADIVDEAVQSYPIKKLSSRVDIQIKQINLIKIRS